MATVEMRFAVRTVDGDPEIPFDNSAGMVVDVLGTVLGMTLATVGGTIKESRSETRPIPGGFEAVKTFTVVPFGIGVETPESYLDERGGTDHAS